MGLSLYFRDEIENKNTLYKTRKRASVYTPNHSDHLFVEEDAVSITPSIHMTICISKVNKYDVKYRIRVYYRRS